jgi:hypothetical protein
MAGAGCRRPSRGPTPATASERRRFGSGSATGERSTRRARSQAHSPRDRSRRVRERTRRGETSGTAPRREHFDKRESAVVGIADVHHEPVRRTAKVLESRLDGALEPVVIGPFSRIDEDARHDRHDGNVGLEKVRFQRPTVLDGIAAGARRPDAATSSAVGRRGRT